MTDLLVPSGRPRWSREIVAAHLAQASVTDRVALVGVRGYYRDTMGRRGTNDVGIYDDAIFVVAPDAFAAFNANVDPGRFGVNPKLGKPYAHLRAGLWWYRLGRHKGNPALVQAEKVTVDRFFTSHRDDPRDFAETGWFGINIHPGSFRGTSSEGCQTIYTPQWKAFYELTRASLRREGLDRIPYLLIEAQG